MELQNICMTNDVPVKLLSHMAESLSTPQGDSIIASQAYHTLHSFQQFLPFFNYWQQNGDFFFFFNEVSVTLLPSVTQWSDVMT